MKKRAFISVSDKTGVVEFAKSLCEMGLEVISTGGTLKQLQEAGVAAISVTEVTHFPECLDGRVKTMHPAIHAGILAMRSNPDHMKQIEELDVTLIDVVAINLYPFKATIAKPDTTFEEAIENIDIGGPTAIRAAAKNWQDVYVVCDAADYDSVIEAMKKGDDKELKKKLSAKVFEHTANYDAMIANYLSQEEYPKRLTLTFEKVQDMRYGENPHQTAAFYKEPLNIAGTLADARQIQGKELSFNNVNDTDAAIGLLKEFNNEKYACVGVKHANPCGVAMGSTVLEAYTRAYEADNVSIFGGIVAINGEVDKATAEKMCEIFLEVIVAPSYSKDALSIFAQKPNLRILKLDMSNPNPKMHDYKRVAGGLLVQSANDILITSELNCVTEKKPTEDELKQLEFAWKVVKWTKSNGIVLAKDNATIGVGPGQTNRITALDLAVKYAGENATGGVMASDAFFPFADCVQAAARAGIKAIIQPGGSIRDEDSINLANEKGIAMVFTNGIRHFRH